MRIGEMLRDWMSRRQQRLAAEAWGRTVVAISEHAMDMAQRAKEPTMKLYRETRDELIANAKNNPQAATISLDEAERAAAQIMREFPR